MRVISRRVLREFSERQPAAEAPLIAWFRLMQTTDFTDFNAIKRTFSTADYVAPYTVFDLGGNKYRVITAIHYDRRRIFVRHVFTHPEYDRWSARMRTQKRNRR
jgi:mRNA interferase HigB